MKTFNALIMIGGLILLGPSSCCINAKYAALRTSLPQNQGATQASTANNTEALLLLEMASRNPKMIGIEYGKISEESWFQRAYKQDRFPALERSLYFFFALHSRRPKNFNELDESGLFPIRPLDPTSGQPFCYGCPTTSQVDFINIPMAMSDDNWMLSGQAPSFEGKYNPVTDSDHIPDMAEEIKRLEDFHYNPEAMRGAMLASFMNQFLRDYACRRNMMPGNSVTLLDGLWYVAQKWAADNSNLDCSHPSTFLFGFDEDRGIAFAEWRTADNHSFRECYRYYSPWPSKGWYKIPSYEEMGSRWLQYGQENHGICDELPDDYVPPMVIWRCSLRITND